MLELDESIFVYETDTEGKFRQIYVFAAVIACYAAKDVTGCDCHLSNISNCSRHKRPPT